jgi:hypothetical protein
LSATLAAPPSTFGSLRPVGALLALWPMLQGGVLWAWGSDRGPLSALVCAAPALVTLALAATSQDDRRQYIARTLAAALMLPLLQLMWATEPPRLAADALLAGLLLGHVALFLLAVIGLAAAATRIEPAPGVAPLPAATLELRLRSLNALGLPLRVQPGESARTWVIDLRGDGDAARAHRVLLTIDATAMRVRVRERLGASGAAPRDADEASMRAPGDPAFDPTRPPARRVWARVAQTTMIEPQRLAGVQLRWSPEGVAAAQAGGRDAESLLALIAAVVVRSGWRWQPVLFLRHG